MRGDNDGREQAGIERTRHITEFDGAGTKKMNLSTIGQRKFGPGYSSDNAGDGPHYIIFNCGTNMQGGQKLFLEGIYTGPQKDRSKLWAITAARSQGRSNAVYNGKCPSLEAATEKWKNNMTTEGAVDSEFFSLKNGESTIDEETRKLFRGNPRPPIYDLSGKLTNPQDHPKLIQAMREEAKREACDPMLKAFVTSLQSTTTDKLAQPKQAQGGSQAEEEAAKIVGGDHRSRSSNYKRKEDELEEAGTTRG